MRTSSLLSLAIAAAAVAASPALHAQTPTPNGRSTLVLVAPADSNRILRAVLTRASRLVESRSGGAVRVDVQYRGVTEESMVLSPGQNGAGVVLVGSGLPRVCAGVAALRVPRDLSASDFDRGFAGVRAEVEATCRSALSPVAWFSAGPRYFVSQATTRGAAASPVASPDMLREYYSPTATLDEANLYGFHVGDLTPRLFLSPGVEVDAAAAAMPPSTVGPSGVLMVPMGAHVGVVAFASSALAALAPAQRTMVSTIFRDAERALTTDLRRASEASIASLANRNLTVIRPAGDDLGAWTRLTTAVESRYLRSATTGTILQHFLAAAGQPLPSTPTPTPTTPTVTTAPAETTTPTPSPAMAPAAVVDATPDSGTIAPTTAAATSMAGRYSAVAPTWTGNLMLDADGTFTRDNGTSGRWTYDASTLSLAWGTRPAENLFLSQPGRFESRMHLALTQLGPRTVPSFEFSLTDLNDGPTRDAYRQLLQASVTPSLRTCYTRTLGRSPGTQGRFMVRVVIEPTGVVRTGEVSVNTVNDSALTTCVVTAARRFPVTPAPVAPVEFELGVTFFAQ